MKLTVWDIIFLIISIMVLIASIVYDADASPPIVERGTISGQVYIVRCGNNVWSRARVEYMIGIEQVRLWDKGYDVEIGRCPEGMAIMSVVPSSHY